MGKARRFPESGEFMKSRTWKRAPRQGKNLYLIEIIEMGITIISYKEQ